MFYESRETISVKEYFLKKPKWLWLGIFLLVLVGFGASGFGVYELLSTHEQEIVTSTDVEAQVCEQTADFGQVTVYVSGAVVNPGVYILESGDRIVDSLEAAGGISNGADKVYVNRQLNLAKRLSDGDQIYIPTSDEVENQLIAQFANVDSGSQNSGTSMVSQQLISINSSTKSQLMELSGIGETRASKIIENRPFGSLQELVEKGIISQSLFAEIEAQIQL